MKRLLIAVLAIGGVFLIWIGAVSSRFWIAPKLTSQEIAGIKLPKEAVLVERRGDSINVFYKWRVSEDYLNAVVPPPTARESHGGTKQWQKFDLGCFGSLKTEDLPSDAQVCYYNTDNWAVALLRSPSEGTITIAGINTD